MGIFNRQPGEGAELRACLVAFDVELARLVAGILRVYLYRTRRVDPNPPAAVAAADAKLRGLVELLERADGAQGAPR